METTSGWEALLLGGVLVAALVIAIFGSVRRAVRRDASLSADELDQRDKDDAW
jgi:hypothetical protein